MLVHILFLYDCGRVSKAPRIFLKFLSLSSIFYEFILFSGQSKTLFLFSPFLFCFWSASLFFFSRRPVFPFLSPLSFFWPNPAHPPHPFFFSSLPSSHRQVGPARHPSPPAQSSTDTNRDGAHGLHAEARPTQSLWPAPRLSFSPSTGHRNLAAFCYSSASRARAALLWQNRLNYPGSSAQTITIKATLA